jgi:hypothetical protein
MKRMIAMLVALGLALGSFGCAEKSSTTTEKTTKTPGGTTTEKKTEEIKKTGDNPP